MRRTVPIWIAFVVVHTGLIALNLTAPGAPLGDVQWVYPGWVHRGLAGEWVGIQLPFVYPLLALIPITLPQLAGDALYPVSFLVMVSLLNAVALRMLLGDGRARRVAIAGGWLAFLAALGPIALGRIDAATVPLGVAAVTVVARHPRAAAVLLTVATWIKVWPAALIAALVVADGRRRTIAAYAAGLSALIVVVALILGSGTNVLSFVGAQAGRGLQIEALAATPFVLGAAAHGPWSLYYDTGILTYQVSGPGVDVVGALMTPQLAVAVAALLVLGAVGVRRGVPAARLAPWLGLSLVVALIVVNKVGSPQFVSWLAVPVIWVALEHHRAARAAGGRVLVAVIALALVIAALTQAVYPTLYGELLSLHPVGVSVLVVRNALEVALLALAVVQTARIVRAGPTASATDAGAESGRLVTSASLVTPTKGHPS